jgi:biopolymer transport protein TolR
MPAVAHKSRRGGRRAVAEINMVPFIDVILVLLIIFMVTAPLITPSQIQLPSVGKANKTPDRIIQVIVERDDKWLIKEGKTTLTATSKNLAVQIKKLQQQTGTANSMPVIIAADKTVRYETVVKVMDILQRAGTERVGLSVQTVGNERASR